jgi:membrane protease YdiL (CAAX protease family)
LASRLRCAIRVSPILVTSCVWSLLLAAPLPAAALGEDGALLATQCAAVGLLAATRKRGCRARSATAPLALGLAAGYTSFPAWVAAAIFAGLALAIDPIPAVPPGRGGPLLFASVLVAAPLLEELLYRERLFDAIRARWRAAPSILATSFLFAVPHLEPWAVLATFLVGLGLGALRERGAPIGVCIAAHAGLNLASIVCGSPPTRLALPPLAAAIAGGGLAVLVLRFVRARATPERDAWANRAATVVLVALFLVVTRLWLPDPETRARWQYFFVVTLGYGHLLGAAVFAHLRRPRDPVRAAFVATSALTLLFAYAWLAERIEGFFLPLLFASIWHTVENDLALGAAYRNGLRHGALARAPAVHLTALGLSILVAVVSIWALHSADPFAAIGFADLFAASTLYHLFSWLVLLGDRIRRAAGRGDRAAARTLVVRLAWVHLPIAGICIALQAVPAAALAPVRELVFSPAVYLFWSFLHVVQTTVSRGLPARRRDRALPRPYP